MNAAVHTVLSLFVFGSFTLGCATSRPSLPSGRPDPLGDNTTYGYFVLPTPMYQDNTAPKIVLMESVRGFIAIPNEPVVVTGENKGDYVVYRSEKMGKFIEVWVAHPKYEAYIAFVAPQGHCVLLYKAMTSETAFSVAGVAGSIYNMALGPFPSGAEGDAACLEMRQGLVKQWLAATSRLKKE